MTVFASTVVDLAQSQAGDQYVYGAEVALDDPDPKGHGKAFDCSELVQWAVARAGGSIVDGSAAQLDACRRAGTTISVVDGVRTRGALLFIQTAGEHHVVISRGDGSTIEARGRAYGVGNWPDANRPWTHAGRIPGVEYGSAPPPPQHGAPPLTRVLALRNPHMQGHDVEQLQAALNVRGAGLRVDGDFGRATDAAVRRFQGGARLVVDGQVGPKTWAALFS